MPEAMGVVELEKLEETPLKTPFEKMRERQATEAWQEAQSSEPSMHFAELGTSTYPCLDNDGRVILEYIDFAGIGDAVARFVVRVISGVAMLDVWEPESSPLSDRA